MAAKKVSRNKHFRLRIYKNPAANSYRVDLALPALAQQSKRSSHAYVGTVVKKLGPKNAFTFEGPLRALHSDDVRRDFELASRAAARTKVAVLELAEQPLATPRHRVRKLRAAFIVAAGRYDIEARYASGEAIIVGTGVAAYPHALPAKAQGAQRRSRPRGGGQPK